ncbi:dihydroorotate dehydrogenase electron transfer subunit [Faecalicatena contorta]|uniref:dihydroorotate dehydrogenase electron transfer subunit n=1 Tax=Faecalicatena contorta TaxID=39482 RepID=UPI0018995069|nr:dihydroorotate dehydrogenase electron transfer subunit [Faecalicatena contorta]
MSNKRKESALIVSQQCIAADIYSMWIQTEKIASLAVSGQFISMYTKDGSKLLPRPISLCEIEKEKKQIRVVYRVTGDGTGTQQFSKLSKGDRIDILGPLGNGFPVDEAASRKAVLIGGGIGVPPMLELAKQMPGEKVMVMGYRDEQFLTEEFKRQGRLYIATENGSAGTKGNVMDAIAENALTAEIIYACGPSQMLRAIKQYAEENNIVCYVSMEERMACGIGACLACVCQSKEIDGHSHVHNKRVCKDGPVFLSTEVEI